MSYSNPKIAEVAELLKNRLADKSDKSILQATELKALYAELPSLPADQKGPFGKELNTLRRELEDLAAEQVDQAEQLPPIDVTAPFDINTPLDKRPALLSSENGSRHPLTVEQDAMLEIFSRMGFSSIESRQIDDDYHMFGSLNFPEGHPARDEMDTFMVTEKDANGRPFVAPAHTSTMQNRVLQAHKDKLASGEPIAVVVPGRVFRNEDLDARHEHTFYQIEGIYVGKGVNVGHLIATLKAFMQEYYGQELAIKTQPFYFPFTEPSFEFAQSCPFCEQRGCSVCSQSGWIELLGCGMIHPNVLKEAGIDPNDYTGFAWGMGFMRMIMIKYGIEDIRHLEAGKLDFLRQFS